jgi:hypothetical protein
MQVKIPVLVSVAVFASLAAAGNPIRAGWFAQGYRLAQEPVFQLQGTQRQGTVMLLLALSRDGSIQRVKSINGEPELRSIVLESVKNWRFLPVPELPATVRAYVYFTADEGPGRRATPAPPPPPFGECLSSVEIEGVSSDVRARLVKFIGLQAGSVLSEESLQKAKIEAKKIDPALLFVMTLGGDGRPMLRIAPAQ